MKQTSKTDYKRLHEDHTPTYDIDNPSTDEAFWVNAQVIYALNGRYQTLINQVLRQYMNAHQG